MTNERREKLEKVLALRQENLTVVMENIEDPHNVAAVLRTCESVGIQEVYLVDTLVQKKQKKIGVDIGFRSSSGAAKWMTIKEYSSVKKCVDELKQNGYQLFTTALNTKSVSLYQLDLTQKVALVFGNEKTGITAEMLQHADTNFFIPQVGIIQSLNVSVACAVSVYEAYRQKVIAGHYEKIQHSLAFEHSVRQSWGIEINATL